MSVLIDTTAWLKEGGRLDLHNVPALVAALLDPQAPSQPKSDFLAAQSQQGENADELAAFAQALLPYAVDPGFHGNWQGRPLFDCCGTGGGGLNILNISTAIMFVLAAAGVPVVKHGNRGVTKKSGSADVLEALGIKIDLTPEPLRRCLEEVGCAFVYAPTYHPSFKAIAPVRKELATQGQRTIFNLLGPLLNPARPDTQLVGVFKKEHLSLFEKTLKQLKRSRYAVVYGEEKDRGRPIGEYSIFGANIIVGNITHFPEYHVKERHSLDALLVSSAQESAQKIEKILSTPREPIPGKTLLLANAAVGLVVAGKMNDFEKAFQLAAEQLDSGAAHQKLQAWRKFSATL